MLYFQELFLLKISQNRFEPYSLEIGWDQDHERAFSILVEPLHFAENVSTFWELSAVDRIGQRM